nr:hypothetical protein [Alphaproteobacteria bacterium]
GAPVVAGAPLAGAPVVAGAPLAGAPGAALPGVVAVVGAPLIAEPVEPKIEQRLPFAKQIKPLNKSAEKRFEKSNLPRKKPMPDLQRTGKVPPAAGQFLTGSTIPFQVVQPIIDLGEEVVNLTNFSKNLFKEFVQEVRLNFGPLQIETMATQSKRTVDLVEPLQIGLLETSELIQKRPIVDLGEEVVNLTNFSKNLFKEFAQNVRLNFGPLQETRTETVDLVSPLQFETKEREITQAQNLTGAGKAKLQPGFLSAPAAPDTKGNLLAQAREFADAMDALKKTLKFQTQAPKVIADSKALTAQAPLIAEPVEPKIEQRLPFAKQIKPLNKPAEKRSEKPDLPRKKPLPNLQTTGKVPPAAGQFLTGSTVPFQVVQPIVDLGEEVVNLTNFSKNLFKEFTQKVRLNFPPLHGVTSETINMKENLGVTLSERTIYPDLIQDLPLPKRLQGSPLAAKRGAQPVQLDFDYPLATDFTGKMEIPDLDIFTPFFGALRDLQDDRKEPMSDRQIFEKPPLTPEKVELIQPLHVVTSETIHLIEQLKVEFSEMTIFPDEVINLPMPKKLQPSPLAGKQGSAATNLDFDYPLATEFTGKMEIPDLTFVPAPIFGALKDLNLTERNLPMGGSEYFPEPAMKGAEKQVPLPRDNDMQKVGGKLLWTLAPTGMTAKVPAAGGEPLKVEAKETILHQLLKTAKKMTSALKGISSVLENDLDEREKQDQNEKALIAAGRAGTLQYTSPPIRPSFIDLPELSTSLAPTGAPELTDAFKKVSKAATENFVVKKTEPIKGQPLPLIMPEEAAETVDTPSLSRAPKVAGSPFLTQPIEAPGATTIAESASLTPAPKVVPGAVLGTPLQAPDAALIADPTEEMRTLIENYQGALRDNVYNQPRYAKKGGMPDKIKNSKLMTDDMTTYSADEVWAQATKVSKNALVQKRVKEFLGVTDLTGYSDHEILQRATEALDAQTNKIVDRKKALFDRDFNFAQGKMAQPMDLSLNLREDEYGINLGQEHAASALDNFRNTATPEELALLQAYEFELAQPSMDQNTVQKIFTRITNAFPNGEAIANALFNESLVKNYARDDRQQLEDNFTAAFPHLNIADYDDATVHTMWENHFAALLSPKTTTVKSPSWMIPTGAPAVAPADITPADDLGNLNTFDRNELISLMGHYMSNVKTPDKFTDDQLREFLGIRLNALVSGAGTATVASAELDIDTADLETLKQAIDVAQGTMYSLDELNLLDEAQIRDIAADMRATGTYFAAVPIADTTALPPAELDIDTADLETLKQAIDVAQGTMYSLDELNLLDEAQIRDIAADMRATGTYFPAGATIPSPAPELDIDTAVLETLKQAIAGAQGTIYSLDELDILDENQIRDIAADMRDAGTYFSAGAIGETTASPAATTVTPTPAFDLDTVDLDTLKRVINDINPDILDGSEDENMVHLLAKTIPDIQSKITAARAAPVKVSDGLPDVKKAPVSALENLSATLAWALRQPPVSQFESLDALQKWGKTNVDRFAASQPLLAQFNDEFERYYTEGNAEKKAEIADDLRLARNVIEKKFGVNAAFEIFNNDLLMELPGKSPEEQKSYIHRHWDELWNEYGQEILNKATSSQMVRKMVEQVDKIFGTNTGNRLLKARIAGNPEEYEALWAEYGQKIMNPSTPLGNAQDLVKEVDNLFGPDTGVELLKARIAGEGNPEAQSLWDDYRQKIMNPSIDLREAQDFVKEVDNIFGSGSGNVFLQARSQEEDKLSGAGLKNSVNALSPLEEDKTPQITITPSPTTTNPSISPVISPKEPEKPVDVYITGDITAEGADLLKELVSDLKTATTNEEREGLIYAIETMYSGTKVLLGKYEAGGDKFVYNIEQTNKVNQEMISRTEKSGQTPAQLAPPSILVDVNVLNLIGYNKAALERKGESTIESKGKAKGKAKQVVMTNSPTEATKKKKSAKKLPLRGSDKERD